MNIRSLTEYDRIIAELNNKYNVGDETSFLFRGHGKHNQYELLPGIFRRVCKDKNNYIRQYHQDEKAILLEYLVGCSITEIDHKTLSEFAQHYEVPTRQLDFTEDPYVALYFACSSEYEVVDDFPSVWLFNRVNYLKFFYENEKSVDQLWNIDSIVKKVIQDEIFDKAQVLHNNPEQYIIRPYIYKPERKDPREVNQKSWFMIWGARQDPLDVIVNMNCNNVIDLSKSTRPKSEQILGVITIDPAYKEIILNELSDNGYYYSWIYPTLPNHGGLVKKNNCNYENTQYKEYRSGGRTLILQDNNPTKEKWGKVDA